MMKPWTVSRGPVVASAIDVEKAQAIADMLTRPVGILPSHPGDHILPFEIGLFAEMRALLKSDIAPTRLRRAVAAYVHTKRYYFASAQPDAFRHDLDGKLTVALSDADRMVAQNRFMALKQKAGGATAAPVVQTSPAASLTITKTEQIRTALLRRSNGQ